MKKHVPLALAAILFAAPAFANKDDSADKADHWFNKIDTNSDGMISKAEHDEFGSKMFREADTNGDRMISREEMRTHKQKYHSEQGKEEGAK